MSKYYDPQELFSGEMSRVAPAFAQTRYSSNSPYTGYNGPRDKYTGQPSYYPNTAALELYNVNNSANNPIIQKMISSNFGRGDITNYGHTEPRLMRYGLDTLIEQNQTE